jgi:hypothetical protein
VLFREEVGDACLYSTLRERKREENFFLDDGLSRPIVFTLECGRYRSTKLFQQPFYVLPQDSSSARREL